MKKVLAIAAALIVLCVAAAAVLGCASAPARSSESGPSQGAQTVPRTALDYKITDWQGASLGREVPAWVDYASDRDKPGLSRLLKLEGKEIYIFDEEGADLDLIRADAEMNAFAEIAVQIQNGVTVIGGSNLKGSKDVVDSKQQFLQRAVGEFSKQKISGFIRDRDFWQKLHYNDGRKTVRYYAVYVIDSADLKLQIDRALDRVPAATQAEREAKEEIKNAIDIAQTLFVEEK
ncbi:MAG: hypothetical protein LBR23_02180 [Spirochaetaceae bacterium]|jgi:hypothetical protein|nr:hypothetical protein [Spirochaetaceae bacterium]